MRLFGPLATSNNWTRYFLRPSWLIGPHSRMLSLHANGKWASLFAGYLSDNLVAYSREMYNEFVLANKLMLDKKLPATLLALFHIWAHLFTG